MIEKYHNEVIKCIQTIFYAKPTKMSFESKIQFFTETRHSYGHTALMLSGGATFGKFHFGVIQALYEQDLIPRIICGSSVGSLVCAAIACSTDITKVSLVIHQLFFVAIWYGTCLWCPNIGLCPWGQVGNVLQHDERLRHPQKRDIKRVLHAVHRWLDF